MADWRGNLVLNARCSWRVQARAGCWPSTGPHSVHFLCTETSSDYRHAAQESSQSEPTPVTSTRTRNTLYVPRAPEAPSSPLPVTTLPKAAITPTRYSNTVLSSMYEELDAGWRVSWGDLAQKCPRRSDAEGEPGAVFPHGALPTRKCPGVKKEAAKFPSSHCQGNPGGQALPPPPRERSPELR